MWNTDGGCFTVDFYAFAMDLGGFLARGFAHISSLSTKRLQKTNTYCKTRLTIFPILYAFYFLFSNFIILLKLMIL